MSSDELYSNLLRDIKDTGYPLELKIAKFFTKARWHVQHSSYYIDKDEGKGREIDLITSMHKNILFDKDEDDKNKPKTCLEINLSLIIEIKESKDKPWVFFTTEPNRTEMEFPLIGHFKSVKYSKVKSIFRRNGTKLSKNIGRNFYVEFSGNGGRDDIFKALTGTRKALEHFKESSNIKDNTSGDLLFYYYEPVIVLKGKLFEGYLEKNIELREVNYLQVAFNYLSENYDPFFHYVTHIVTVNKLSDFIEEKEKQLEQIFKESKRIFTN